MLIVCKPVGVCSFPLPNRIPFSEMRPFPVRVRHLGRQRSGTLPQREKGNEVSPFLWIPAKNLREGQRGGMREGHR